MPRATPPDQRGREQQAGQRHPPALRDALGTRRSAHSGGGQPPTDSQKSEPPAGVSKGQREMANYAGLFSSKVGLQLFIRLHFSSSLLSTLTVLAGLFPNTGSLELHNLGQTHPLPDLRTPRNL